MAMSKRVGRMDIRIARDAEGGGVSFARDRGGGLFAHLTHPYTLVAGRKLIGAVDFVVTRDAEKRRIGPAEDRRRRRFAGVTRLCRNTPATPKGLHACSLNHHLQRKNEYQKKNFLEVKSSGSVRLLRLFVIAAAAAFGCVSNPWRSEGLTI